MHTLVHTLHLDHTTKEDRQAKQNTQHTQHNTHRSHPLSVSLSRGTEGRKKMKMKKKNRKTKKRSRDTRELKNEKASGHTRDRRPRPSNSRACVGPPSRGRGKEGRWWGEGHTQDDATRHYCWVLLHRQSTKERDSGTERRRKGLAWPGLGLAESIIKP